MKKIAFAGICSAVFVLSVQAIPSDARREEAARQADGLIEKMTPEERLGQLMMDSPEIKDLALLPCSRSPWVRRPLSTRTS